ncbi:MAG TPA: hypothetical protein VJ813_07630 [Vicinamibacterales bacterium]|nr:hypothetical protein [Vicinamibacterales bacterium]
MTPEAQQTRLLARTFFSRLFETDLMTSSHGQVQLVISVIVFLAAPALILPILVSKKYFRIRDPDLLLAAMAQDRTMALLLATVATAMITLVLWENVFPDQRDSRHLGVLPIRQRSFVLARMIAMVALFVMLFLGTTALAAVTFGLTGSMFHASGGFFRIAFAHFIAVAGAEAFVFFSLVMLQCALMSIAGPGLAHRFAVVLQVVFVVTVLQTPLLLPGREAFLAGGGGAPPWSQAATVWALPPMWFLALFEFLARGGYPGTRGLATLAAIAGGGTPILALAFYAASYGRLTRLAIEGRPLPKGRSTPLLARGVSAAVRATTSVPVTAAVCAFTLRTLARSRQHRMLLAGWIGVATAFIISSILPVAVRVGWSAFERPHAAVLVGPLILSALTITGMRMLFALPVEIRANWTFRLREPVTVSEAVNGAEAALVICGVLPAVVLALVSAGWLWGITAGLMHAVFCGVMAMTAVQFLMRGVDKIPFTCTYFPGKAQIGKFWPLYLTAFTTFTYSAAFSEVALLESPVGYGAAVVVLGLTGGALAWSRRRDTALLPNLRFEEEPMDGLTVMSF